MPDCPQSLSDFHRRFPSEAECAAWLFAVRWPDGFRCPACGHGAAWALQGKAHTFECAGCSRQTSVTAGTLFRDLTLAHQAAQAPPVDVAVGFYEVFQNHFHNSCLYATLGGTDAGVPGAGAPGQEVVVGAGVLAALSKQSIVRIEALEGTAPASLDEKQVKCEPLQVREFLAYLYAQNYTKSTTARKLATRAFQQLVKHLVSAQISDTQCGLKLFSRPAAGSRPK